MSVTFFRDTDFSGESYTHKIADHPMDSIVVLPSAWRDTISSVKYNLPAGMVVTLMDDIVDNVRQVHSSYTFDCIGVGRHNLSSMNDKVSAVYASTYDTSVGYVELYQNADFSGNRICLFLSKYTSGKIQNIGNWALDDRVSSIRWKHLGELIDVVFYDNTDGSGVQFGDAFGWNHIKEIASLRDVAINDRISAFKWTYKVPRKEEIQSINFVAGEMTVAKTYRDEFKGTNDNGYAISHTLEVKREYTSVSTCTLSNSNTWGWSVGVTISYSPPDATGGAGISGTVGFEGSRTQVHEHTTSISKTESISTSTVVTVDAHSSYDFEYVVRVGTVPTTDFETTAVRWYDVPVAGGDKDPANNNWYKRSERLVGKFAGGFATDTVLNGRAVPLAVNN